MDLAAAKNSSPTTVIRRSTSAGTNSWKITGATDTWSSRAYSVSPDHPGLPPVLERGGERLADHPSEAHPVDERPGLVGIAGDQRLRHLQPGRTRGGQLPGLHHRGLDGARRAHPRDRQRVPEPAHRLEGLVRRPRRLRRVGDAGVGPGRQRAPPPPRRGSATGRARCRRRARSRQRSPAAECAADIAIADGIREVSTTTDSLPIRSSSARTGARWSSSVVGDEQDHAVTPASTPRGRRSSPGPAPAARSPTVSAVCSATTLRRASSTARRGLRERGAGGCLEARRPRRQRCPPAMAAWWPGRQQERREAARAKRSDRRTGGNCGPTTTTSSRIFFTPGSRPSSRSS